MHYSITLPQFNRDSYEHEFTPQLQSTIKKIANYFFESHYAAPGYEVNRLKFSWYYVYDMRTLTGQFYFYDQMETDFEGTYTGVHIGQGLSSHVHFIMSEDKKTIEHASLSNSGGPFKSIELKDVLSFGEYIQVIGRDRYDADTLLPKHALQKEKQFWIRATGTPGPSEGFYFSVQCPIKYIVIGQNETPSV